MDVSATEIVFTDTGCNFCDVATKSWEEVSMLFRNFEEIRNAGRGKKYDCLVGLSGGVDSSYALTAIKALGLRPLAFSVDNGWNTPESDENVFNLVEKLRVPFEKHAIDRKVFKELQASFIAAGQKNIEIPTDHVLMAISLKLAAKYGIKHIISGGNVATESIMPKSWGYQPRDLKHIEAIYKWHTKKNLKGLPTCGLLKWNWYKWVKGIKTVYILDYFGYNRELAKQILMKEYSYKDVGEKHEESIFTKWFQNFYLFEKFGIDKRKAHYSSLIVSGQMTRSEALERLGESPIYPELGIEKKVLKYARQEYTNFPTDEKLYEFISKCVRGIKKLCTS